MLKILARPAWSNRTSNPFNSELYSALVAKGAQVDEFYPWSVLCKRYDVIHVHWPESSFKHNLLGALLTTTVLLWALRIGKWRGAKVVWTVHNLHAHERKFPKSEARMWRQFLPLVDTLHAMTSSSLAAIRCLHPILENVPGFVVPHGHYRKAYPEGPGRERARELLGIPQHAPVIVFVGQILDYKNVPALMDAFLEMHSKEAWLIVAGRPHSREIARQLQVRAANNSRIQLRLKFLANTEIGQVLHGADIVVLPYREILNSGSALLALSFDRPVLMPMSSSSADLRTRVGDSWVSCYEEPLSVQILQDQLQLAMRLHGSLAPLDSLSWHALAAEFLVFLQN